MKTREVSDISADIGPMAHHASIPTTIPMYAYARPASILWQAVFEGMIESGKTEKQAIEWLQSKGPRYCLDGTIGDQLRELGLALGRSKECK